MTKSELALANTNGDLILRNERVGKHMIRPLLSLERLSFSEKEGKVSYYQPPQADVCGGQASPPRLAYQEVLLAAEDGDEHFS